MSPFRIVEEAASCHTLQEYGTAPVAFETRSRYRVDDVGEGDWALAQEVERFPWTTDYDAVKGNRPFDWVDRFDTGQWCVLSMYEGDQRLGGAVMAHDITGLLTLENRGELAVAWDIRVLPERRGDGIGSLLFPQLLVWTQSQGCSVLKMETQNINVPASEFCRKMGCRLGRVSRGAYPDLSEEIELDWYRTI